MEWKVEVSLKSNINDAVGSGIAQDIKDLGITDVEQVRTAQLYWLNGDITEKELETICVALLTDSITQRYAYSSGGNGLRACLKSHCEEFRVSCEELQAPLRGGTTKQTTTKQTKLTKQSPIVRAKYEIASVASPSLPCEVRSNQFLAASACGLRLTPRNDNNKLFRQPLRTPINDAWIVEVNFKPGVTDAVGDSVMKGIRDLGISGVKFVRTGQKYVIKGNLTEEQIKVISRRLLANEVIHNFVYSSINSRLRKFLKTSEV